MELDALLAPITDTSPCGDDLSFSPEFDQIADMRRQDDPTLDQGAWVTALKVADWPGVADSCTRLLSTRTKDLRLVMWLTEAWALTSGYAGLAQGLQLCRQLCERHWEGLHPQPDDGDFEERIGNMGWLLTRVVALSQALPLTQGRQGAAYSLRQLAMARQAAGGGEREAGDASRQSIDPQLPTLEQFQRALKETPAPHLLDALRAVRQCEAQLLAWQKVIDGHLGANGPSFVPAKEAVSTAIHDMERLAREAGVLAQIDVHGAAGGSSALTTDSSGDVGAVMSDSAQSGAGMVGGPLRSRTQALQQLREVAQFFRQTEPHSPVAYLAEKAVKWGEMPLHEWLRKVIKDQGSISHLEELLGLDTHGEQAGPA